MALLSGILVGFLLALPPATILLVGVHLSMVRGFRRAVPYVYGTALVDMFFAFAAMLGVRPVMELHRYVVERFPVMVFVLQVLLVMMLISYGIYLFASRVPMMRRTALAHVEAVDEAAGSKRRGPFLLGAGINITNVFSPTFIGALAILAAQAQRLGGLSGGIQDSLLFALGYGLATVLYLQLWMAAVARFTSHMGNRHLLRLQKISGVTFIGIGGLLMYYAITNGMG